MDALENVFPLKNIVNILLKGGMKVSSTTMLSPDQSLNFGSRITCHAAAQFLGQLAYITS